MKHQKQAFFIKGLYAHSQIHGYLTVKQYIMLEQDEKHCLLIRFENEMKTAIQEVAFTVKQLDAQGKFIGSIKICYSDLNILSGQMYCAEQGIVIDDECVDCVIQMKYLISGPVKYVFKKGLVTEHYDTRGYAKPTPSKKAGKTRITIRRKYMGGGACFRWIAVLSFMLAIACLCLMIYRSRDIYQSQTLLDDCGVPFVQKI